MMGVVIMVVVCPEPVDKPAGLPGTPVIILPSMHLIAVNEYFAGVKIDNNL